MNHISFTSPVEHSVNGADFATTVAEIAGSEKGWSVVLGTIAHDYDTDAYAFKPLVTDKWTKPVTRKRVLAIVQYEATKARKAIAKRNAANNS